MGHIGIVEKAQETSWDTDMHNTVHLCHQMNSGCVLEYRDTRISQVTINFLISICP